MSQFVVAKMMFKELQRMILRGNTMDYLILSIVPWMILGSIMIFSHSSHHTASDLHPSLLQSDNRLTIHSPQRRAVELKNQYIKKFQQRSFDDEKHDLHQIYVDWPLDSEDLSYLNYKSFESLLSSTYIPGKTQIEVMIIAKNTAHHYKIRNILSKQTFLKYKKKGYAIETEVYGAASTYFTNEHWIRGADTAPALGKEYFIREFTSCCDKQEATKTNFVKELPIALWLYGRIAKLYGMGGEFYDLTWFHQYKLSTAFPKRIQHGIYMISYCYNSTTSELLSQPRRFYDTLTSSSSIESINDIKCSSSMMMMFPKKNHPVLKCVLEEYDQLTSKLHKCLDSSSDVASFFKPFIQSECVRTTIDHCFTSNGIVNELDKTDTITSHTLPERLYLGTNVSSLTREESSVITPMTPILWLGPNAVSGQWIYPSPKTYLGRRIETNNRVIQSFADNRAIAHDRLVANYSGTCSHYKSFDDHAPIQYTRQASASCALSFVLPGFMKAGTTFLFDMIGKHPQVLLALRGFDFKETACYYKDLIDTPRSYDRMNCFPFVEEHENMIFGDGTVYYVHRYESARYLKRDNPNLKTIIMIRDPIERSKSHHRYLYSQSLSRGIGDINLQLEIALTPNSRLNKILELGQKALNEARLGVFDGNAMKEYVETAAMFYKPGPDPNQTYERSANTFFSSLYFHPIYLWDGILGKEHIYVVEAERMSSSRLSSNLDKIKQEDPMKSTDRYLKYTQNTLTRTFEDELADVFQFIGLTPFDKIPTLFEHVTGATIPNEHLLTEESEIRLNQFFAPFNELLSLYLDHRRRNLGHL